MKKNILKSILFISILFIILSITSYIFIPKHNGDNSGIHEQKMHGILGEKKNTIDILFIGDSESYTSFIPLKLYDDYGFTSYNLGTSNQRIYDTYEYLKLALNNQSPKIVILETNVIFTGVPKNDLVNHYVENIFKIFKYHDRWKHLNELEIDYPKYKWTDKEKNYPYNIDEIKPDYIYDYMIKTNELEYPSKLSLIYLELIRNICTSNNIDLILLSSPSIVNWNYKKHNYIEEYTNKYNLNYIDLNIDNKLKIDWYKDTCDKGDHLNYYGSLKVTKRLGSILNKMNILDSHRNNKEYSKWDNDLKYFKENILNKK